MTIKFARLSVLTVILCLGPVIGGNYLVSAQKPELYVQTDMPGLFTLLLIVLTDEH